MMENNFEKILLTNEQIMNKLDEMANSINNYYKNKKDVLIVPILDGSIVFAGQLVPKLDFDLLLKSTKISLYDANTAIDKSRIDNLKIDFNPMLIENKDVLIIEDLIDTGNTLDLFKTFLLKHKAKSVKICVLFKKDIKTREKNLEVDWYGFMVPDKWIAGFGVDSKLKFRNFKHLGVVKKNIQ